jgi:2-oxoglutarate ferredoxin oxidoreductase subunit delta
MTEKAKRWRVPEGWIYVDEEVCKGCGFCHTFCPKEVLAESEKFNPKGYHPPEVVDPEACVLCGFCELLCPDFAIWTEKLTTEETENMEGSGKELHREQAKAQRTPR